jgi:hypothetical protein
MAMAERRPEACLPRRDDVEAALTLSAVAVADAEFAEAESLLKGGMQRLDDLHYDNPATRLQRARLARELGMVGARSVVYGMNDAADQAIAVNRLKEGFGRALHWIDESLLHTGSIMEHESALAPKSEERLSAYRVREVRSEHAATVSAAHRLLASQQELAHGSLPDLGQSYPSFAITYKLAAESPDQSIATSVALHAARIERVNDGFLSHIAPWIMRAWKHMQWAHVPGHFGAAAAKQEFRLLLPQLWSNSAALAAVTNWRTL